MLFLETLKGKSFSNPPLWIMRQAGRYLPEYREVRKEFSHFLDLVFNSEKAAEVTLQPIKRFNFDAAILFSDILVIPYALGQEVSFDGGVKLSSFNNKMFLEETQFLNKLKPIFETTRLVRKDLSKDKALIGFAGGPFTVLCYMLEEKSTPNFPKALSKAFQEEEAFQRFLSLVTEATVVYLLAQIEAGANAIQLFETWAGCVPFTHQEKWLIKPLKTIVRKVREKHPNFPIIAYIKGASGFLKTYVQETEITALSLDGTYPLEETHTFNTVIQGNLDPLIVMAGGSVLENSVKLIKESMKGRSHIFNLGHGILPQTPLEHVEQLVSFVRNS